MRIGGSSTRAVREGAPLLSRSAERPARQRRASGARRAAGAATPRRSGARRAMQHGGEESAGLASEGAARCFTPAGLRVLVVDDDKTCLRVISRMLEQCNYEGALAALPARMPVCEPGCCGRCACVRAHIPLQLSHVAHLTSAPAPMYSAGPPGAGPGLNIPLLGGSSYPSIDAAARARCSGACGRERHASARARAGVSIPVRARPRERAGS